MADPNDQAFRQFELELDDFFKEVAPKEYKEAKTKIALQALRGVVLKTPVDTGRARGNWSVGDQSFQPDTADPSGAATIARGTSVILSKEVWDIIVLANNVPYILRLEDGSSRQAPQGMVAVTLAELQVSFRG